MKVRRLGRVDYAATYEAMRAFTAARSDDTPDELWLCEHPSVFTLGQAGRREHVLAPGDIPVVQTDRGGQVTYHGPGQVVAYPLVDLKRLGLYVKEYVYRLEQALLKTIEALDVTAHRVTGAPGLYVNLADPRGHAALPLPRPADDPWRGIGKIAALGLKLSRHRSYHGVALNVAMDLEPFSRIDPCGHAGLRSIDLSTIGAHLDWDVAAARLAERLQRQLAP